jgi:hypothetical protein
MQRDQKENKSEQALQITCLSRNVKETSTTAVVNLENNFSISAKFTDCIKWKNGFYHWRDKQIKEPWVGERGAFESRLPKQGNFGWKIASR